MERQENRTAEVGVQNTVGIELLQMAEKISCHSEEVRAITEERLAAIMMPIPPEDTSKKDKELSRNYPPYFDELRNMLHKIQHELLRIEGCINRTAL